MASDPVVQIEAAKREVGGLYRLASYLEESGNFEDADELRRAAHEISAHINAIALSLKPAAQILPVVTAHRGPDRARDLSH